MVDGDGNGEFIMDIQAKLFSLQDKKFRDFQVKLLPTVTPDRIIGVRTPALRQLARNMAGTAGADAFLAQLPHRYFEENQLHAFILSASKDYEACIAQLDKFLPYVDNWATCDQMSPKVFKKHRQELVGQLKIWLASPAVYAQRFAIGMLMTHFLDDDFDSSYLKLVAAVRSEEYYVKMMIAWYFATALAKQYTAALPFIEAKCLEPWTHNKAIQKARESLRVTDAHKAYLRTLKVTVIGK